MKIMLKTYKKYGKGFTKETSFATDVNSTTEFVKFMIGCGIELGFDEELLSSLNLEHFKDIGCL